MPFHSQEQLVWAQCGPPQSDLQCTVTINIFGKPYIHGEISLTIPYQHICLTMELHPRPCSIPSPSPGCHGHLRHCRRAPSILHESVFPFAVFATNSASSSCMHYTGSGTPTYTAGSTPQASSRQSTLTHRGYFAGRSIKDPTPNRSAMFLHPGFAVSRDSQKFLMTCSAPFPPPTPHTPGCHLHLQEQSQKTI